MSRFLHSVTSLMQSNPRLYFKTQAEYLLTAYPGVSSEYLIHEAACWYYQAQGSKPTTPLAWCQALSNLTEVWDSQRRSAQLAHFNSSPF
jgi:hypothetical protein